MMEKWSWWWRYDSDDGEIKLCEKKVKLKEEKESWIKIRIKSEFHKIISNLILSRLPAQIFGLFFRYPLIQSHTNEPFVFRHSVLGCDAQGFWAALHSSISWQVFSSLFNLYPSKHSHLNELTKLTHFCWQLSLFVLQSSISEWNK